MSEEALPGESPLAVFKCVECGDTFPAADSGEAACPSCGGSSVEPAAEPLL
jgi:rRNA maturation endonuclease Nob1